MTSMQPGGRWQLYAVVITQMKVKENGKGFQTSAAEELNYCKYSRNKFWMSCTIKPSLLETPPVGFSRHRQKAATRTMDYCSTFSCRYGVNILECILKDGSLHPNRRGLSRKCVLTTWGCHQMQPFVQSFVVCSCTYVLNTDNH